MLYGFAAAAAACPSMKANAGFALAKPRH